MSISQQHLFWRQRRCQSLRRCCVVALSTATIAIVLTLQMQLKWDVEMDNPFPQGEGKVETSTIRVRAPVDSPMLSIPAMKIPSPTPDNSTPVSLFIDVPDSCSQLQLVSRSLVAGVSNDQLLERFKALNAAESGNLHDSKVDGLLTDLCDLRFQGNPGKITAGDLDQAFRYRWIRTNGVVQRIASCPQLSAALGQKNRDDHSKSIISWRDGVLALPSLVSSATMPSEIPRWFHPHSSEFLRVPKTASWVVGHNICGTCEPSGRFFMNSKHKCFLSLWGIGRQASHPSMKRLVSASRMGRNAIFKEREGSFQYGGMIPQWNESFVASNVAAFVEGSTIWNGAFEVDNVGHVIHDALWAWALTLMLKDIAPTEVMRKSRHSSGSIKAVFAHDFDSISSTYFGALSWIVAQGEQSGSNGDVQLFRSPFPLSATAGDRKFVCFQELILPGQDRHVDGGGNGLRMVVARRIRRHIFNYLHLPVHSQHPSLSHVRALVYGRNDVYRRSFDNTHVLFYLVKRVVESMARKHSTISLVKSFGIPVEDQIRLMSSADVFVAIQGSHMQNTLFMPEDAVIIELAPCRADRVSFIQRYGKYLDSQRYTYLPLCDGVVVNYSEKDPATQNVTLCPHMLQRVEQVVTESVADLLRRRRLLT